MARDELAASVQLQRLLLNVSEELKLPLLQIARQAELTETGARPDWQSVQTAADTALRLLDNYILGVRLTLEPKPIITESVSVPSVLYDTGQQLDALAKAYGVNLELNIQGRFGPVISNRQALQAALVSAGAALIEALPAMEAQQLTLQLGMHRSRYGLVAGLYSTTRELSRQALRQGRALQTSRQPLRTLTHTSGAGIFVADAILRAMNLKLTASRHHRLYGLGTVLQPNPQLQLV